MIKYHNRLKTPSWCLFALLLAVYSANSALADEPFRMSSPSIQPGASIAADFTCSGGDSSPAIEWTGAPASTRSFAMIVDDPDAPSGIFIHWVVFNVPSGTTALKAAIARDSTIPGGGSQGVNGFGNIGYNGPCPPPGKVHHYHFRVFALDSKLDVAAGANAGAVQSAMNGHVVASAEFTGTFSR